MVQAILRGDKTHDRRLVKPANGLQSKWADVETLARCPSNYICEINGKLGAQFQHPHAGTTQEYGKVDVMSPCGWFKCPYGAVGDVLWVRETWALAVGKDEVSPDEKKGAVEIQEDRYIVFKADSTCEINPLHPEWGKKLWKPSLYMPKSACRLFLRITDIRVERLNDISEEDAVAEGIEIIHSSEVPVFRKYNLKEKLGTTNPVLSFQTLWESINGKGCWDINPWVWVVSFVRVDKPENF
jgi:hypothetical protein